MSKLGRAATAIGAFAGAAVAGEWLRYDRALADAERRLEGSTHALLGDIGTVEELSILPLVERNTSKEGLLGEAGVSYLISAGADTILFDAGLNRRQGPMSTLAFNARALNARVDQIGAAVISHLHADHVGGVRAFRSRRFTLGGEAVEPRGLQAFVPVEMHHERAEVRVTTGPTVIAPGVALLPPLPGVLFWIGTVDEQALLVNVRGAGLVLVSGCGHPGVAAMLTLTERVLDVPICAFVGGLHLSIRAGRGYHIQATLGSPRPPWNRLGDADVEDAIRELRERGVVRVAVSGHDSTPAAMTRFADAFGEGFEEVVVGREIRITS
ncbi:MAG: MBL fold metallo-hydrolase [Actinomycetota bacterium]